MTEALQPLQARKRSPQLVHSSLEQDALHGAQHNEAEECDASVDGPQGVVPQGLLPGVVASGDHADQQQGECDILPRLDCELQTTPSVSTQAGPAMQFPWLLSCPLWHACTHLTAPIWVEDPKSTRNPCAASTAATDANMQSSRPSSCRPSNSNLGIHWQILKQAGQQSAHAR